MNESYSNMFEVLEQHQLKIREQCFSLEPTKRQPYNEKTNFALTFIQIGLLCFWKGDFGNNRPDMRVQICLSHMNKGTHLPANG